MVIGTGSLATPANAQGPNPSALPQGLLPGEPSTPHLREMLAALPPGTKIYYMDSVRIIDGTILTVFPAANTITRTLRNIVVYDPQIQQSFTFSSSTKLTYMHGGVRIFVLPGRKVPNWILHSNIQRVEIKR